ncbi:glycosyltransferase family 4 protein [Candidatus Omnitrophota bacterium]
MKIGIDIRSTLKKTRTGIGRYTINLVNALAGLDNVSHYYLYSRKKILDFKRRLLELPRANFHHCADYFKKGPEKVLPSDIDIFHTSSYDLEKPKKARFIVTIHDVINKAYPHGHTERTIQEIDARFEQVLPNADALVADSYNTKSDLVKFYDIPDSKIFVIYPGVDPLFKARHVQDSTLDKEEYVLFVGTLEPRKNIDGLIRAFTWLKKKYGIKHKLYIVGMKGWMFEDIFKARDESEFKDDIVFKGRQPMESLEKLYQGASVFAYPSFYEGFGLPIVEAFGCGVPVVTSRTSSCGEIGRDSALLIDPANYNEIGEAIYKIINNKALKEELIKKGVDRAREFTWTRAAREFLSLFKEQ